MEACFGILPRNGGAFHSRNARHSFAALSAYCIPLITSFTIDYVLIGYAEEGYSGGIAVAPWIERLIDSIGGIPFLEQHLYIMGIALIAATGVNALSVYIRRSQIAYGAETMSYNMRNRLYSHLANVPYDYYKHIQAAISFSAAHRMLTPSAGLSQISCLKSFAQSS